MPIVKHSSRQLTLKQFPRLHSPEKISSMNYSHNEIRAIQSNIALSCNLMYIDISYNLIVRIDNLALLPNLLSVDVSHNRICDVPECMIALKKLEIFDLSFNRINSIYQIRVLKEMMNKREGKLRVSIEGNEIIKVKNNWELLGRWFSFNQKDQSITESWPVVHRQQEQLSFHTAKSVEQKENQFQGTRQEFTHRDTNLYRPEALKNIKLIAQNKTVGIGDKQLSKEVQVSNEHLKAVAALHGYKQCTDSLNNSNQIRQQFINDLSNDKQQTTINNNKSLLSCLNELKVINDQIMQISHNFTLISRSQQLLNYPTSIAELLCQSNKIAQDLCILHRSMIALMICNDTQSQKNEQTNNNKKKQQVHNIQKYELEISSMSCSIRQIHRRIITQLGEHSDLTVGTYQHWVTQYRRLKIITIHLPAKLLHYCALQTREEQLSKLTDLSPDKYVMQKQLNELLYSKQKEACLLDSDAKSIQSIKASGVLCFDSECSPCFIFREEIKLLRQELHRVVTSAQKGNEERERMQEKLTELDHNRAICQRLLACQQVIIEQLNGKIDASTYQHVLLAQAKSIESVIYLKKERQSIQLEKQGKKICFREQPFKTVKAVKLDTCVDGNAAVSEFQISHQPDKLTNSSGYFQKRGLEPRRQETIQITQRRYAEGGRQRKIVVSNFESQPSRKTTSRRKQTQTLNEPKHKHTNGVYPIENSVTFLSQQIEGCSPWQNNSVCVGKNINKLSLEKCTFKQKQRDGHAPSGTISRDLNRIKATKETITRAKTTDKLSNLNRSQRYVDPTSMQEGQRYKEYMQYHLRNSIIQILSKKNRTEIDPQLVSYRKASQLTAKQQYIGKSFLKKEETTVVNNMTTE